MIQEDAIQTALKAKTAILSKRIVEAMPTPPQAIYLVGGYGRGEGAWYEDEHGLHPYNDFDVAVICDESLPYRTTENLRKELASELGISWVDIDYYSINKLKAFTPTIHNVDLLEGSMLIFGEDVVKRYNIHLDSTLIGKEDLIKLYWTRMWTFLGSWEGTFRDLEIEEARFFRNQMAKATLAACDMRLLKLKKYTTSYCERAQKIMSIFSDDKELSETVGWAIAEKLRPSSDNLSEAEMTELYFKVKSIYLNSFRYALDKESEFYLNPDKTKQYSMLHRKVLLLHIYSLLRYHESREIRRLDVSCAMNYVFLAKEKKRVDENMLRKASTILLKQGFIKEPINDWDDLRAEVAKARNNI